MAGKRILILGAGAAGTIASNKLARELRREIARGEVEILINDKLGESFNIVLLRLGAGYWRFADDPPETSRKSEVPRYWT